MPVDPSTAVGPGGNEPRDVGSPTNLLAVAWQSRWLISLLMVLGAAIAWALLQRAEPMFTSTSRIIVERNLPKLLDAESAHVFTANYLNTQAELIRSTPVIAAVVEQPNIKALPIMRETDSPVTTLRKRVSVKVGQNDDIISIAAHMSDPVAAAEVVNAVVDAYVARYAEDRRTDLFGLLEILQKEKVQRDAQLKDCRRRLDAFLQEQIDLAGQVDKNNVVHQRFEMLADVKNAAELELTETKAHYERVNKMHDTPSQHRFLLEMASNNTDDTRRANLENQIHVVEQALAEELTRWDEGYQSVKLLRKNIKELERRLEVERKMTIDAFVEKLRQDFELMHQQVGEVKKEYETQFKLASELSSHAVKLESLQEEYARAEQNCDLVDERIKQINLSEQAVAMNVDIIETAPLGYQSYPSPPKFLVLGLAFGGFAGFGLGWLRDLSDQRFRSAKEVVDVLRLPVLGVIPRLGGKKSVAATCRIVVDAPHSRDAEAVRTLRTGLKFGLAGDDVRVIVVTSPASGDGRSTISSNLAIALSQVSDRVLLIDADMRSPSIGSVFGIPATTDAGLATVLAEQRSTSESIHATSIPRLDVLPCGPVPANPVELLSSEYFSELLEELGSAYTKIVIDTPPLMPVADARLLASVADCALLVLRHDRTTRRIALQARDELRQVRVGRIGVVVNGQSRYQDKVSHAWSGQRPLASERSSVPFAHRGNGSVHSDNDPRVTPTRADGRSSQNTTYYSK
jgi:capsular exopolysaccharide synthesis family protein